MYNVQLVLHLPLFIAHGIKEFRDINECSQSPLVSLNLYFFLFTDLSVLLDKENLAQTVVGV
jgi:hypothetical protein